MKGIIEKAKQYFQTYSIIGRAHYIAWEVATKKNNYLGIPVVITTTIVGAAIFGTIQENPDIFWKTIAGSLSLLAAVLSALQTNLKYNELAEKHKIAGAKYSVMRRYLDVFLLKYNNDGSEEKKQEALLEFERIADEFAKLAEESPSIPDKIYDQAKQELNENEKSDAKVLK